MDVVSCVLQFFYNHVCTNNRTFMSFFKTLDKTQNTHYLKHRLSNVQNFAYCIHIFKEALHLQKHWFKKLIYYEYHDVHYHL